MKRAILCAGLIFVLAIAPAQAKKKSLKGKTVQAEQVIAPNTSVTAKVGDFGTTSITLTFEVPKIQGANNNNNNRNNANRNLQNMVRQLQRNRGNNRNRYNNRGGSSLASQQRSLIQAQQRIAQARTPQQRQQAIQQYQRAMQSLQRAMVQQQQRAAQQAAQRQRQLAQQYAKQLQQQAQKGGNRGAKITYETTNVVIKLSDKVAIRSLKPPFRYDEMGNPKKYTDAELKALKGTSKLPGYEAKRSDIVEGAVAKVTVAKNKSTNNELVAVLILIDTPAGGPGLGGADPLGK